MVTWGVDGLASATTWKIPDNSIPQTHPMCHFHYVLLPLQNPRLFSCPSPARDSFVLIYSLPGASCIFTVATMVVTPRHDEDACTS